MKKTTLSLLLLFPLLSSAAGPIGTFYTPTPQDSIHQVNTGFKIYSTHAAGTQIYSFVDVNQKIVAISWEGVSSPDLSVLLGGQPTENNPNLTMKSANQGRLKKGIAYLSEAKNTPNLLKHPLLSF
jgi:hypothetical protein